MDGVDVFHQRNVMLFCEEGTKECQRCSMPFNGLWATISANVVLDIGVTRPRTGNGLLWLSRRQRCRRLSVFLCLTLCSLYSLRIDFPSLRSGTSLRDLR